MKKLTLYILTVFLSITFVQVPVRTGAETHLPALPATANAEAAEANALLARIHEIHAMDKTRLSSSEKKQLRKEVRATEKRLKESGGGVYLSVGAIIIIVLLLILLL